ncbi:family 1 encapsulin nanocompartment shell protein [Klebsiella pneumoniae]|uniref:Klebsiella pneumoniae family 1 encapsulin shell n=1 Tax=Klebsiella pneumoniae TaxID=573 RepID=A0AAT8XUH9_KLEPN|nr:family 1 encapsulin nanocompartment shell protein [Klebsiella pneumoniae]KAB7532645.1 bacteriocin [Klebsiella pneumoniae]
MNNLHRELAPVSDAAWEQIEEEASRTLKRFLAARRVVDVSDPQGPAFSAVGTGHVTRLEGPGDSVGAVKRQSQPVVEFRVPFILTRQAIDDVERGSQDSDWSPLKEAARKIAGAEDRAVFDGYAAAGIGGIRPQSSNSPLTLPVAASGYPDVIARALDQLRVAGVNGPYHLVLGENAYTLITSGNEDGYPVLQHIHRLIDGEIVWAPAIEGGVLLSTRGGDFAMDIGQDISIGYLSHTATHVELYLQESFTFRTLTSEAVVSLLPSED